MSCILVVGEYESGRVHGITEELIGGACGLKVNPQDQVAVAFVGPCEAAACDYVLNYGADQMFILDSPWVQGYNSDDYALLLKAFIEELKPEAILLPGTSRGREYGAKTAAALGIGLLTDVTEISRNAQGKIAAVRPAYDGESLSLWQLPEAGKCPFIMSIRSGILEKQPYKVRPEHQVIHWSPLSKPSKKSLIKLLEKIETRGQTIQLSEASVIVAAGRGLKSIQGMEQIRKLARLLGGEVGCTRPCVDAGWAQTEQQIGQTGVSVKPELYLAFGVSGAIQHMAGLKNARYVVAVNTDPQAPIFRSCDFGIIGDAKETAEALIDLLEHMNLA